MCHEWDHDKDLAAPPSELVHHLAFDPLRSFHLDVILSYYLLPSPVDLLLICPD